MTNGRSLLKQVQPPQPPCYLQTEEGKSVQQNARQNSVDGEGETYFQKSLNKLIFPTHTLSQSSFTHTCLGVLSFYGMALHLRILLTSASINIRPGCCPFFSCLGYVLFLDGLTGKGMLFVMHFNLVFLPVLRGRIFYRQVIHAAVL